MGTRVGGKYKVTKKLGSGSFGEIYLGLHVTTAEEAAIKLEGIRTEHQQLLYEAKVIRYLRGGVGIPELLWCGTEADFNVMIIELLGPSLEDLFNYCHRKFSLKTVLMIGEQMLSRLEYIHSKGFIHRDVKPDNFLMGANQKSHQVYIIDFGLSKRFIDPRTSMHIPYRNGKSLTGTARYASINTHLGIEQGRRDDLEGLAYVLLYFLRGQLPWQGMQAFNQKDKYHKICVKKQNISVRELCKGVPEEIGTFLCYCRNLKFDESPNYSYCRKLLRAVFEKNEFTLDYIYDWTKKQSGSTNPLPKNQEALPEDSSRQPQPSGGDKTEGEKREKLEKDVKEPPRAPRQDVEPPLVKDMKDVKVMSKKLPTTPLPSQLSSKVDKDGQCQQQ
ncbi:hypothetical protein GUITHDRAFT_159100 [Guillardia theta CCMP2712]|uniref:non-specific serine/threonine protein kinase n=1 Tax=Guillardia theta (strain CCMP2712) TaxID=905079 RepID=L1K2R0_GUITC|nr:hypothetical protein GUITHDRAFT_159100 [Guillardia theta CCMP2712]EKX54857.1 hypothetical protein GUITHDRAFT_159100 [Guillardia theta CCMP2712]|eukprot:XP_005841837.1 hypothetical protein GUITHDRAFT_159100 [Guillardia theta CCMP2712]